MLVTIGRWCCTRLLRPATTICLFKVDFFYNREVFQWFHLFCADLPSSTARCRWSYVLVLVIEHLKANFDYLGVNFTASGENFAHLGAQIVRLAACFEQLGANIKYAIQGIPMICAKGSAPNIKSGTMWSLISHLAVDNHCVKEILSRAGGTQVGSRDLIPS